MNSAYTPNGFANKPAAQWNPQSRSSFTPPPTFPSPARGRGRGRRGNGRARDTPPAMDWGDDASDQVNGSLSSNDQGGGMNDSLTDMDVEMQRKREARRLQDEELRDRKEKFVAKRKAEGVQEKQEEEELLRHIAAEDADPVFSRVRAEAIEANREWERRLLDLPADQAWKEVINTREERIAQWQELRLMGRPKVRRIDYRPTRGLCEGMCAASEIVERVATNNIMAVERDPTTRQPDPARFVKRWRRPGGGEDIPSDVRTFAALVMTTGCLLDGLLNRTNYGDVYGFLEDRCRAVMTDYSVQNICGPSALHIYERNTYLSAMGVHEKIARFYAFSAYVMYDTYRPIRSKQDSNESVQLAIPSEDYSPRLNKDALDRALVTLKDLYTDNHTVRGGDRTRNLQADLFDREPEMAAYRFISNYVKLRTEFRRYHVEKRDWETAQARSGDGKMPRDVKRPDLTWDYAARMTPWMFLANDLIQCAGGSKTAHPPTTTTPSQYAKIIPEVRFFDLLMLPYTPPLFLALFMEEFGWIRVQAIEKLLGSKPGFIKTSTLMELLKFDSEKDVSEIGMACGLSVETGADGAVRVGWRSGDLLNFVDPVVPRQASLRVFEGKFPSDMTISQITSGDLPHLQSFDGYPQLELQPHYEVVKPTRSEELEESEMPAVLPREPRPQEFITTPSVFPTFTVGEATLPSPFIPPQERAGFARPFIPPQEHAEFARPFIPIQEQAGFARPFIPPQEQAGFARPFIPLQEQAGFAPPFILTQQQAGFARPSIPPQEQAGFTRPFIPAQEQAGFARPFILAQEQAGFARPFILPQEQAGFARPFIPPQEQAGFARPFIPTLEQAGFTRPLIPPQEQVGFLDTGIPAADAVRSPSLHRPQSVTFSELHVAGYPSPSTSAPYQTPSEGNHSLQPAATILRPETTPLQSLSPGFDGAFAELVQEAPPGSISENMLPSEVPRTTSGPSVDLRVEHDQLAAENAEDDASESVVAAESVDVNKVESAPANMMPIGQDHDEHVREAEIDGQQADNATTDMNNQLQRLNTVLTEIRNLDTAQKVDCNEKWVTVNRLMEELRKGANQPPNGAVEVLSNEARETSRKRKREDINAEVDHDRSTETNPAGISLINTTGQNEMGEREEHDSSVGSLQLTPPKRAKFEHDGIPLVNGIATPSSIYPVTPPKKGTLHSLRARIRAANAMAAGELRANK
ncbi:hypothetical protein CALVIDRAFT_601912 [Calocera viscosa TUFC12733]|uniref:SAC3/GANP/THP3 conserved domain-containing protein n=1 Tax=Calocera viscosa (strain TUFC12733) TaxID=1330018 RepID=A0A167HTC2_CALVF|nr:hypothetical protein CALVIDRAFT_601912 [Calocera viscosa TUFC12733]